MRRDTLRHIEMGRNRFRHIGRQEKTWKVQIETHTETGRDEERHFETG